jgi:Dolichyl-phosphate-mannose-protein mannosyltransferase
MTGAVRNWRWWALSCGWAAAAIILYQWVWQTPPMELRQQLQTLQFWTLALQLAAFAFLTVVSLPSLYRLVRQAGAWAIMALASSSVAWVLSTTVAPRTNRIYYDEHIYQHIGQNLSDARKAQVCNDGVVEYGMLRCSQGEYNKQLYGYPQLLGFGYRIFGTSEELAFRVNNLAAFALVWVIFCTTALLFKDGRAAGFASLIAALIPEQLRWSNTAAVEPSASLMSAIVVLTAAHFVQNRSRRSLAWLVSAAAFAIQFRAESVLILPVVGAIFVCYAADELRRPRFWLGWLIFLLPAATVVAHFVSVWGETWGAVGPRTSVAYFSTNLAVNGPFYYADSRFPAVFSILAVVGLLWATVWRAALLTLLYFALFWGVFLFFHAGSYDYGADVRFSLMTYPPVAVMAGVGVSTILRAIAPWFPRRTRLAGMAVALIAFQFLLYMPYVRAVGEEAWAARADVEYARQFAAAIPPDSFVLTHNPSMFLLWGKNSAQTSIAAVQPEYVTEYLLPRYRGGVYLHWGFWCNVDDPVQAGFCRTVLDRFPSRLQAEHRRWSYRYALYRLEPGAEK